MIDSLMRQIIQSRTVLTEMKIKRFSKIFLFCLLSLLILPQVDAAVITWTNGGPDQNWNTGANWSSGVPPTINDQAQLNNGDVVILDGVANIEQLVINGGSLTITTNGSLTIDNNMTGQGLNMNGAIFCDGLITIDDAVLGILIRGSGNLTIGLTGSVDIANIDQEGMFINGTLDNTGMLSVSTVFQGIVVGNGTVDNSGTITITNATTTGTQSARGLTTSNTFTNTGAISITNCDNGLETSSGTGILTNNASGSIFLDNISDNGFTSPNFGKLINIGTLEFGANMTIASVGEIENGGIIRGFGNLRGDILNNTGTLQPGANLGIGSFTIKDGYSHANGLYQVEIEGTAGEGQAGGNDYMLIRTANAILTGGDLEVSLLNGFVPEINDAFLILEDDNGGNIIGVFNNIILPPLPADRDWDIDYSSTRVTLSVIPLGPTPVELVNFDATLNEENVTVLDWQSETEINTSLFEIERSTNGKTWTSIGVERAAGQSFEKVDYSFLDFGARKMAKEFDRLYYRLKMIDLDGTFEYSPIASVNLEDSNGIVFKVAPTINKAGSMVNIHTNINQKQTQVTLSLFNSIGQLLAVYSPEGGSEQFSIEIPANLADGVYFMNISDGQTVQAIQRIIIKR